MNNPRNIMPGANSSALGLSSQPQNTAGMNLHQIERCPVSLEKQQQMKSMNLAMKHQVITYKKVVKFV
jgi:hypothetical protein